jgi:8-oxo-dGTP pyrophosphatase MutT (NUDIX family)
VPAESPAASAIQSAATVLLLRDGALGLEILLMQRASQLAFHGGAWAFPGGRVDPGDLCGADALAAARGAAVRETYEESGLVIAPEQLARFLPAKWRCITAMQPTTGGNSSSTARATACSAARTATATSRAHSTFRLPQRSSRKSPT